MYSLESPHRGDSNKYTQHTVFSIKKKKITLNYSKSAAMGFFEGIQERVRNSCGKRAISVRATEVLLYYNCPKYGIVWFYSAIMGSNNADRTANSVDPWSAMLAMNNLFQYLMLGRVAQSVGHLTRKSGVLGPV